MHILPLLCVEHCNLRTTSHLSDAPLFSSLVVLAQAGWSIGAACSRTEHVLARPGGLLRLAARLSIRQSDTVRVDTILFGSEKNPSQAGYVITLALLSL
jgi:hypothetical protein